VTYSVALPFVPADDGIAAGEEALLALLMVHAFLLARLGAEREAARRT